MGAPAREPVIVVAGPTAAGKSAVAVDIAEAVGGEILNADSMQVYRFLDIGTAKPSAEMRGRVPHHLFDVVNPDDPYSAGRYLRDARAVASALHGRAAIPVLCGGTGLYLRAFLEGLIETGAADPERRAALEAEADEAAGAGHPERLHARLAELDPESAARIHPNDRRRVVRALEIAESSGAPASTLRGAHAFGESPFRTLYLVLDPGRERLDERIAKRTHAMIDAGLLRETRDLLERGYGPELRPLQAIGYRHLIPVAEGRDTLVNAATAMTRDTRRFARRQRTWFRAVADAHWLDPEDVEARHALVAAFLDAGSA